MNWDFIKLFLFLFNFLVDLRQDDYRFWWRLRPKWRYKSSFLFIKIWNYSRFDDFSENFEKLKFFSFLIWKTALFGNFFFGFFSVFALFSSQNSIKNLSDEKIVDSQPQYTYRVISHFSGFHFNSDRYKSSKKVLQKRVKTCVFFCIKIWMSFDQYQIFYPAMRFWLIRVLNMKVHIFV